MTFEGFPKKPQVMREPDGRISVFVGSAYQTMKPETAREMRDQLDDALDGPRQAFRWIPFVAFVEVDEERARQLDLDPLWVWEVLDIEWLGFGLTAFARVKGARE